MKFLCVIFLILACSLFCLSQTDNKQENFRLIQTKPSAYITFEKFDKRKGNISEGDEGVWLRFHNNTKWSLTIKTLGCRTVKEECGIFYEVKRMYESKLKESDVPLGKREAHISSAMTISSGNSVLFSIPKEHLAEKLYIILDFNYEWEAGGNGGDGSGYIFHKVPFYSTDLPKEKKN